MDTIPFHLTMLAVDGMLVWGFLLSPLHRTHWGSFLSWGLACAAGVFGVGLFGVLFRANFGQCLVEGLMYHGAGFLWIAAVILFLKQRRRLAAVSAMIAVPIFALGFDVLIWEPTSLVVEHYTIESPKIKYPLRIVFAADIQTDHIGWYERRTMQTIMEQKPDLILLGGDYLQYYKDVRTENVEEQFRNLFREIPLTAPLGVYALKGNLDSSIGREFRMMFDGTGVTPVFDSELFGNWGVDQNKGPIDMALLSMTDSIEGVEDRAATDSGNFSIMAGHYPHFAYRYYQEVDYAPDLMLAGHTHGGQVVLPFYGPVILNTRGRDGHPHREFMSGMHVFANGSHFLVTRGTGLERGWAPRVRFNCKPEISVIDLLPALK